MLLPPFLPKRKLRLKRLNILQTTPWLTFGEQGFLANQIPWSVRTPDPAELPSGLGGAVFGRWRHVCVSLNPPRDHWESNVMSLRLWRPWVLCFQELRNAQSEQLMGIRREEEMEMSDDETCDSPTKKMRVDESGNADHLHTLVSYHNDLPNLSWGVHTGRWSHHSLLFELR